ncbi:CRAL/TRIO domain-containing protein [Atractiella rhizophila]|nr:CRAL/TRIO domain-containing protein [Atractiella rhizophila]
MSEEPVPAPKAVENVSTEAPITAPEPKAEAEAPVTAAPPAPTSEEKPAEVAPENAPASIPATSLEEFKASSKSAIGAKWTEEEWSKVFELSERIKLPAFYNELAIEGVSRGDPLKIWGVYLNPKKEAAGEEKAKAAVVLWKFMKAKQVSPSSPSYPQLILKLIAVPWDIHTLKWRASFKPEETLKEEFPKDVFGRLGFLGGKTKDGVPVTYNIYGEVKDTKETFGNLERFIRWRVSLMELRRKGIAQLDFLTTSTMIQIHDYAGVGIFSSGWIDFASVAGRDQYTKAAASEASKLFADYYPELLEAKWFLNVPTVMSWLFKFFSNFLSQRTLDKFKVMGPDQKSIHAELSRIIDDEQLPKKFGGNAASVLDE